MANVLGIDLGATKLLAHIINEQGRIEFKLRMETGAHSNPERIISLITELAEKIHRTKVPFAAVGIGFPGLVDPSARIAMSSVMLTGFYEFPLAESVEKLLKKPCVLDNDVNNAARAELQIRSVHGTSDMLFLAVGTGIGGALVLNGQLWRGASGLAGEIGHISISRTGVLCKCGRHGCIGNLASGSAIERALGIAPGTLAQAIAQHHPGVEDAIQNAAEALGVGLVNALNLLNIPLIVIGGGIALAKTHYLAIVRTTVQREAIAEIAAACKIERTLAGYTAGATGAALLAKEYFS